MIVGGRTTIETFRKRQAWTDEHMRKCREAFPGYTLEPFLVNGRNCFFKMKNDDDGRVPINVWRTFEEGRFGDLVPEDRRPRRR